MAETKIMVTDFKENLLNSLSGANWKRIGLKQRSGLLVPLFSVYSKSSTGIGDLADLKPLIDWCEKTGNSILQLLPMNEVGPIFCPYDSISSFALEPMYLSLDKIAVQDQILRTKTKILKNQFSLSAKFVDYRVKSAKLKLLWDAYNELSPEIPGEFKNFIENNGYWLWDYAIFCVLKSMHNGKAWYEWEEKYKNRDSQALENLRTEYKKSIIYYQWLQWQLYRQFKEAKDYAGSKDILLKGDLPILVSKDSADVWAHPEYFKLNFVAGAPPDMYCAKGQRWGTPTYDWDQIFGSGGRYVVEKLKYAENFYDILRIDHVVGLFRIWSIPYNDPMENLGLNGSFDPKDETKWESHGKKILSFILNNTKMLLCAEDLGTIPPVCTKTLKEFGIPGNDVQRWTKDWENRYDFLPPAQYREISVTMLSTHDTTNWPAWWENEAGTIDEELFKRKCADRKIDYQQVKEKLFDPGLSKQGRLRWKNEIISTDMLISILGKPKEEVKDFIDLYANSFKEKEKLWKVLGLKGSMREGSDKTIVAAVTKKTLEASSIFFISNIFDWLYLTDKIEGDPYQYRINTPGTIRLENWSLLIPISLDELLKDKVCLQIKGMVNKYRDGSQLKGKVSPNGEGGDSSNRV